MFVRELKESIRQLKGVGPTTAEDLSRFQVRTISELIMFFPRDYEDRLQTRTLDTVFRDSRGKGIVNTVVEVVAQDYFGWGNKRTLKVYVQDSTATAALICFGRNFLAKKLTPGRKFFLYGRFTFRYNEIQSSSFEVEAYSEKSAFFGKILPVYPLTGSLTSVILRKIMKTACDGYIKFVEDELPPSVSGKYDLLAKSTALRALHFPDSREELKDARRTLIYEELFYLQLFLERNRIGALSRDRKKKQLPKNLQKKLAENLPFELTEDQRTALEEIFRDSTGPTAMNRLLQGDVGSGKTLVAVLSALPFVEGGMQAAFMAPTELLALQLAEESASLLEPLGVRVAFLSGSVTGGERKLLLDALRSREIDILVGTHALFSEDVHFPALQFVVIDEQHRFGVLQRMSLVRKGSNPDILLMTATPIPRTLALTVFGDLEVSSIRTMPADRKPIVTHLAKIGNEEKVYRRVRDELKKGRQAYFVYPLIEESEKLDLKNAESMYSRLEKEVFPEYSLGLIHSKIPEEEKKSVMHGFLRGEIDILIATSVVEVGVNVPNATCMVVEHADRFGLSALHQLRGRVGRGKHQSYAFLVFSEQLTEEGKQRLKIMKESTDGFYIAEEDLKLRGIGNLAGTSQSGFFQFSIADPIAHLDTMVTAKEDARQILQKDPGLLEPEHGVIRRVLEQAPPFTEELLKQA